MNKPSIVASNLILITSGQPPTIYNLPVGYMAYGKMNYDNEYHIFLNSGTEDGIIDFHNPMHASNVILKDGASVQDKFDMPFSVVVEDGELYIIMNYGSSTINPFVVEDGNLYMIPNDEFSENQFVIEDGVLYFIPEAS